jgi:hypothetical protein
VITIADLARMPTSAISEAELERGGLGRLGPRTLTEACGCGGVIVAEDDSFAIADAVHAHNESTSHAQWAIRVGMRQERRR